jgi:CubicO group peptidase (beta-lactamase class C family)
VRDLDLASLLGEHMSTHAVPGAAVGVLCDTEVTVAYGGVADATTGEPVTAATRFAVGSLAKSMVATVVARLAEAGRWSLEDPVATHVPELGGVGWAARATLRDLLANRSQLPLRAASSSKASRATPTTCCPAWRQPSPRKHRRRQRPFGPIPTPAGACWDGRSRR